MHTFSHSQANQPFPLPFYVRPKGFIHRSILHPGPIRLISSCVTYLDWRHDIEFILSTLISTWKTSSWEEPHHSPVRSAMPVFCLVDPNAQSACIGRVKLAYSIPGMIEKRSIKLWYQGVVWVVSRSRDNVEGRLLTGPGWVHERGNSRCLPLVILVL